MTLDEWRARYEELDAETARLRVERDAARADAANAGRWCVSRTIEDVRRDPRPGDVVKRGKIRRNVTYRQNGEVYYYYQGNQATLERSCWITTWQDWCRGAEVLHVAD